MTFRDFGLTKEILQALETLQFTKPTEIQQKAIPVLLQKDGLDFHGQAQTGTGKTLAFGLPLLQKIDPDNYNVQALIVAPTRELVLQISQSLQAAAQFSQIAILPVYGGVSMHDQTAALQHGMHIVVGTPGRLNDHLRRSSLRLDKLKTLVLDEADIMLDMGFRNDIDIILGQTPAQKNIWLFSATVKDGITELINKHMPNPAVIRVNKQTVGSGSVKQYFCPVAPADRFTALCRIIDSTPEFYGFIFCQTKISAADIARRLARQGYKASALHGDMGQEARNRTIKHFKDREFSILVATDVAARGIDIPDITHVVNLRIPQDQESYVHRIGRTGRAGNDGIAITLIAPDEREEIKSLEAQFGLNITEMAVPSRPSRQNKQSKPVPVTVAPQRVQQPQKLNEQPKQSWLSSIIQTIKNVLSSLLPKRSEKKGSFAPAKAVRDAKPNSSTEEIYLNIGTDDRISAERIIQFLEKHTTLEFKHITKFKMIKRRTFLYVPSSVAGRVIDAISGKKLAHKKVYASRANSEI